MCGGRCFRRSPILSADPPMVYIDTFIQYRPLLAACTKGELSPLHPLFRKPTFYELMLNQGIQKNEPVRPPLTEGREVAVKTGSNNNTERIHRAKAVEGTR